MNSVEKGREIAALVKEGLHRQGDGYVAGIFFFIIDDSRIVREGLDIVSFSLDQAITLRGCGRHIVPTEDVAHKQVAALSKHYKKLPRALRRFGFLLAQRKLNENEARQVLHGIFLETMIAPEDIDDPGKYRKVNEEAQQLADYFALGLSTLIRALKMI